VRRKVGRLDGNSSVSLLLHTSGSDEDCSFGAPARAQIYTGVVRIWCTGLYPCVPRSLRPCLSSYLPSKRRRRRERKGLIASFAPISMSTPMTNGSTVRTTGREDASGSSNLGGLRQPLSVPGVGDLRPSSVPRLDKPYEADRGGFKMSPRSRIRPMNLVFASLTRCFRTRSPQCGFAPVVYPSFPG